MTENLSSSPRRERGNVRPSFSLSSSELLDRLQDSMAAAGMPYTGKSLKTDGTFNRWDDRGRRNGPFWCVIHELNSGHLAAVFGDWRSAVRHEFKSWETDGIPPEADRQYTEELERRRRLVEETESRNKAQAARRATEVWQFMPETGTSEYLERKRIQAYGIRYGADQHGRFIAVPMRDIFGALTSFQKIYDDGVKRFPKHSEKKACFHLIGELDPAGEIYLAEGYATGVSVYQATGKPVVVCFDAGNLAAVAVALKSIYPDLKLVVAADNDQWKAEEKGPDGKPKGNTGVRTAYAVARAHPGTRVAIPNFINLDTADKPTDFNDLAALAGLENVRSQLEAAKEPRPQTVNDTGATDHAPAGRPYSLQFAVAGQQPQSKVAAILTKHNTGLAYDHVAQKWLQYVDTQWKEITDTAAFRTVQQWIDAGLTHDDGYTVSFINGVTAFLKATLAMDGFDEDPQLVPFKNGVLDLSTMKLAPHSPQLKTTWCLPFDYNPAATCEPVIAWLQESVGGDQLQVDLLRAYIKAIITGRADLQRYLELIGPGGTGKGEFIRLCTNLVGARNTHVTALKHLEDNRFETARLYRKRLCIITDAEKYAGDISVLKAVTGQDDLRFEEKHKQGGENFKFRGMVLIAANQEITSSDYTSGLQRRRITMRFDNQVDPAKRRDLEREFEPYLPGVIAWALALDDTHMKELLVETDRHVPTVGRFNLETLKRVNSLAAWADECLILDNQTETPVGRRIKVTVTESNGFSKESRTEIKHADEWLFANYIEWCQGTGSRELASRSFTGLLKDLLCYQLKLDGVEKLDHIGGKPSRFKGVRLRTEADSGIANLLSSPAKVQQKSSKSPANEKDSPANPAKSKFSNQPHTHDKNKHAGDENENANSAGMQEKPDFAGFAGFAGLYKKNQQVTENFAGPVPDFCWTGSEKSPANSLETPPDPGDDYMDSLLNSLQPLARDDSDPPPPAAGTAPPKLSNDARTLLDLLAGYRGFEQAELLVKRLRWNEPEGITRVLHAAVELQSAGLAVMSNGAVKPVQQGGAPC